VWSKTIPPSVPVTGKTVFTRLFDVSVDPTSCDRKYPAAPIKAISKAPKIVTIVAPLCPFGASIFLPVSTEINCLPYAGLPINAFAPTEGSPGSVDFIVIADPNVDGSLIKIIIPSTAKMNKSEGTRIEYMRNDFNVRLRVGEQVSCILSILDYLFSVYSRSHGWHQDKQGKEKIYHRLVQGYAIQSLAVVIPAYQMRNS
jgi:hypothetical protein